MHTIPFPNTVYIAITLYIHTLAINDVTNIHMQYTATMNIAEKSKYIVIEIIIIFIVHRKVLLKIKPCQVNIDLGLVAALLPYADASFAKPDKVPIMTSAQIFKICYLNFRVQSKL